MTRSLNFGNHLQVPHLLFFSQIPPLHLQRLLQLRISILFSTLPHHFCCLPPSPPSGQSLKQDWQSLQCFLLPYNSSVLVPILVALGPHWVPISLSGSLSIKISIHSLCSSICFLLSKNGICSRPRLMTILFHFLPSFFTLTIGKTVLETWHLRHWLQFWQLRTWIQTIILTWQLIVTLDSIRSSCDDFIGQVAMGYHWRPLTRYHMWLVQWLVCTFIVSGLLLGFSVFLVLYMIILHIWVWGSKILPQNCSYFTTCPLDHHVHSGVAHPPLLLLFEEGVVSQVLSHLVLATCLVRDAG